jgi:hypothetical protein
MALLALAAAISAPAQTPVSGYGGPDTDTSSADTPAAYVSVVGAVPSPATFTARRSPLLLGALLDRAGGLDRPASGTVRIFLRGRLEQEFPYDANRRIIEVMPGSVIVVDTTALRPQEGAGPESYNCDVACVNLLDRPVVRRLSPQDATLTKLLQSFGQPDSLAATVQVMRKSRMAAGVSSRLNPGDVLVFDPTLVDRAALSAALQRSPLRDEQPLDGSPADSADAAGVVERLPTGRTVPEITTIAAEATGTASESPAPRRASLEIISTFPAGEPVPAPPMEPVAVGSLTQEERFLAESIGETLQNIDSSQSGSPAPPYPGTPDVHADEGNSAPSPPREIAAEASLAVSTTDTNVMDPSAQRPPAARPARRPAASSGITATAVTAGLCVFAGLTLLSVWSRRNRHRRVRPTGPRSDGVPSQVEPPAVSDAPPLNEMINDTLPLVEEDPTFPAELLFHGRTLGFRYLLLSGAHGLHGPHFAAGQVSDRLRDHAGAGSARTTAHADRSLWPPPPIADSSDESQDVESAAAADVIQPETDIRTAQRGRHHPSPLERALLARRRRTRP